MVRNPPDPGFSFHAHSDRPVVGRLKAHLKERSCGVQQCQPNSKSYDIFIELNPSESYPRNNFSELKNEHFSTKSFHLWFWRGYFMVCIRVTSRTLVRIESFWRICLKCWNKLESLIVSNFWSSLKFIKLVAKLLVSQYKVNREFQRNTHFPRHCLVDNELAAKGRCISTERIRKMSQNPRPTKAFWARINWFY